MKLFEFNVFVNVEAENYDSAVDMFDSTIKYGRLKRSDIFVADIQEK